MIRRERNELHPNPLRWRCWIADVELLRVQSNSNERYTSLPHTQNRSNSLSVCVCVHGISSIKRNQRRRRSHRPSAPSPLPVPTLRSGLAGSFLLLLRGIVEQPLCLAFDTVVVSMKLQWQKRGENQEEKEDWEISRIEKKISNGTTTTVKENEKKKSSRRSSRALVSLFAKTRGRVRTSIDDLSPPILRYFCPQKAIYIRTLLAGYSVHSYMLERVCAAPMCTVYTTYRKIFFIDNAGALDSTGVNLMYSFPSAAHTQNNMI